MNILEQKQATIGTSKPTDTVLWNSVYIYRQKDILGQQYGPWLKQAMQGTFKHKFSNKLGKAATKHFKRLTHNRRHYYALRNCS